MHHRLGQAKRLFFLFVDFCNEAFPPRTSLSNGFRYGGWMMWGFNVGVNPGPDSL